MKHTVYIGRLLDIETHRHWPELAISSKIETTRSTIMVSDVVIKR